MSFYRKLILGLITAGAAALLIAMLLTVYHAGNRVPGYRGVKDEQDRLTFIRSFGWETEGPGTERSVIIPAEFDAAYSAYNDLQIDQGLDLRRLAGKEVTLFTYPVFNHPSGEEDVVINLLIDRNKVVGGDVMSPRLDGFMHGFAFPENMW